MLIDHIAMYVSDLDGAREFFTSYLGGKSNQGYYNQKTGFRSFFISFDGGSRIEIMNKPCIPVDNAQAGDARMGYIHLAFSVGSKGRVDELTSALKNAGYEVLSGPRTTGDGYYESCIVGFEGNLVEITI